ncbi:MAG: ATP-grasp domain-containing protein, partial [Candidatus Omnitrophica bacterium]|nr:ATP-grasp domain-containing protein [Candidatus Omnitrophota bacterium]
MKILVIGSGGREHALVWKIKQSPKVEKIYCAPGNGGIAQDAECVDIKADNIEELKKFVKSKKIDLTIVGPEAPLVTGIVDAFVKEGLKIFGPTKAAAQLEGSKVFTKEFLNRWNIPTGAFQTFENLKDAKDFLEQASFPIVVKAEGLAAGKGVFICETSKQAREAVDQIMSDKVLKEAGKRIIVEEFLEGVEASILAISDGESYVVLEPS